MTLTNTNIGRNGIILSKHPKTRYYFLLSFLFVEKNIFVIFDFEIDLLTLHITLNHQTNNKNRLSRQNYYTCFLIYLIKIIFHILYPKIDLLTFKMILNHHNIPREQLYCHTHTKKR